MLFTSCIFLEKPEKIHWKEFFHKKSITDNLVICMHMVGTFDG